MGRKSEKAKEKKKQRKEELAKEGAKIAASQAVVAVANELDDPLASLQAFKKYDRRGVNLTIECKKSAALDQETNDWIFTLCKANMQTLYETCDWGWNDKAKREELTEEEARYLIARDQENKPAACVHFRFDLEDDVEVLYCYEIQLEKAFRRKGLGKFLMQILELLAFRNQMKKVMLTVLKHNEESLKFFTEALKYQIDETNPEAHILDEEDYSYQILSKDIAVRKPLKTPNQQTTTATATAVNAQ